MKKLKEIEYEDAPSGYVTLYNYKEPFMDFHSPITADSFGYEGVLLFDGATDKVQCHFCGKWYESLGPHIGHEHNMLASEYKNMVGLSQSTALIGEKFRQKLIANGQGRFKNLRPGKKKSEEEKKRIGKTLSTPLRQYQNARGTCPLQLIDRLLARAKELGRTPGRKEINFEEALVKTYGSFNKACEFAGLKTRKPGQTIKNQEKNKHVVKNIPKRLHISDKELLSMLRVFKKNNGRDPSSSDCRRGLLPAYGRYAYHFGGLKKAIKKI